MNTLLLFARAAAVMFALLNLFGLTFFADHYLSADNRADLLIYGLPIIALVAGAVAPAAYYRVQPTRSALAILQTAAMLAVGVAIYRDITLINGADWPAAIMRGAVFALLLVFTAAAAIPSRQRP
jgi:hypothetical protein